MTLGAVARLIAQGMPALLKVATGQYFRSSSVSGSFS